MTPECYWINQLYFAFQNAKYLFMVQELCHCGNLNSLMKKEHKLPESVARVYACEIIIALSFLHHNEVIHRDLRPENILIDEHGHVKLSNMGMASALSEISKSTEYRGTPEYQAPEVFIDLPYGKALDWYSLGVVLYQMVVGQPPFLGANEAAIKDEVLNGTLKVSSSLSDEIVDLITKLLQRNPLERLGAGGSEEIMQHPFFEEIDWEVFANPEPSVKDLPLLPERSVMQTGNKRQSRAGQDFRMFLGGEANIVSTSSAFDEGMGNKRRETYMIKDKLFVKNWNYQRE